MDEWYQLEVEQVVKTLEVDVSVGLEPAEAQRRLEQYGLNELVERDRISPWKILWEQLTGFMVLILLASAVISALLNEYTEAIAILVIVVLNAILGFTQEYRAEKAMAALKRMAAPLVRVRRGGHLVEFESRQLVPGDVVLLEAGSAVPADCRVVESANLRAQESVLTGESEPVSKVTDPLKGENIALGDQKNRLFMGTIITFGRGVAIVTETGMQTQLGRIADMLQSVGSELTPLQRRLDKLGKSLALVALGIVAVVFVLGLLRGEDIRVMFQTAISMAVAAIPEGLVAVVTIALALGAQRLLQRRALIRKLPAVETLGSVTVICSDKTGTLTENRMTVTVVDVANHSMDLQERVREYSPRISPEEAEHPAVIEYPSIAILLTGAALCNDAVLEANTKQGEGFSAVGDPTEGALVVAAARAGLWKEKLEQALPRVSEMPFDSQRKRMTTVHRMQPDQFPPILKKVFEQHPRERMADYLAITKGSVDGMLAISNRVWEDGKVVAMDDTWRERISTANDQMAKNGMRVLGVGFSLRDTLDVDDTASPLENDLVFVGMVAMIDPAREEAATAVRLAKSAGVRPIMITGDHPLTALYIARQLGITSGDKAITGAQLEETSIEELRKMVEEVPVYARVSPEHKLKIVEALQENGHIVAMTGDGVNDAPALKRADIGVAMGITGTDVSKEASDMVLLDDNFATIVAAVEEGRRIYDNIRKFIRYTMTSNAGEIWVVLLAPFVGMPLPLSPLQILWVNLVTDGVPGLALTVEPAEKDTMQRPPYSPKENFFGRGMLREILWIGLLIGGVAFAVGFWAFRAGMPSWQTLAFTTLTFAQMGNVLALRSERYSLFKIGVLSNKSMLGAVLLTFLLQLAVIYVPFMQGVFETVPLTLMELGLCLGLAVLVFLTIELVKFIRLKTGKA